MLKGCIWLGLALLTSWTRAAELRPSSPEVRAEVVATVEMQLAALRRGDVEAAHRCASAALRARLPVPAFARMLQQTYAEIWRNERATFALVNDDGLRATVAVRVTGKAGAADFEYGLVREPAGWRINGVLRRASPRPGAI